MKILTVKELKALIDSNQEHLIKCDVKTYDPYSGGEPYIDTAEFCRNFKIKEYKSYILVELSNDMGDPEFCVSNENEPIDFKYDNSDSDYSYRLYIEE